MNWDDVRFFLAVARSGRLSTAGRQLGVDHATVSRRLRALEKALAAHLFHRAPSGYSLTPAGENFLPLAEQMEASALLAEGSIGAEQAKISGAVRVGVPDGVAAYIVVKAAQALCDRHPGLKIELIALPLKFSLSKREVDFAIGVSLPASGRLKAQKIADYTLHLYGHRDYLAAQPTIAQTADLKRLRGIGYVQDLIFDKQLDYIPLVDPNFQPQLTSSSVHVQLQAVLNRAGLCILHDFMAERHPELVRVLPGQISFTRSFWLIVQEDYAEIERIRLVSSSIVKHMRESLRGGAPRTGNEGVTTSNPSH